MNDTNNGYRKIISIDLDGVLDSYNGKYDEKYIPEIQSGAKDFVEELYKKYDLILFTTRNSRLAKKWLIKNNLDKYFIKITNKKYPSFIYIDDRAINFNGNYNKTLEDIENFKAHWKTL